MKCLTPRELLAKNLPRLGIVYMYPLKKTKKHVAILDKWWTKEVVGLKTIYSR